MAEAKFSVMCYKSCDSIEMLYSFSNQMRKCVSEFTYEFGINPDTVIFNGVNCLGVFEQVKQHAPHGISCVAGDVSNPDMLVFRSSSKSKTSRIEDAGCVKRGDSLDGVMVSGIVVPDISSIFRGISYTIERDIDVEMNFPVIFV